MKNYFLLLFCFVFVSMASSAKAIDRDFKLVPVDVVDILVPEEFTTESEAYVIARGIFPNGCYQWSHAEVTHKSKMIHEVKIIATLISGPCKMVLVPFSEAVILGRLDVGQHTIRFLNADGTCKEQNLNIQ